LLRYVGKVYDWKAEDSDLIPFLSRKFHDFYKSSCDFATLARDVLSSIKLVRRYSKCSCDVKVMLFRSYCICLYDAALWSVYNAGTIIKLAVSYNRCIKTFFGFTRRDSVTQILFKF